jgi:hypothetical protein
MGALSDLAGSGVIGKVKKYLGDKSDKKKRQATYSDSDSSDGSPETPMMHSGGTVKRTGEYRLRKGERVMTKGQMKKMRGRKSR